MSFDTLVLYYNVQELIFVFDHSYFTFYPSIVLDAFLMSIPFSIDTSFVLFILLNLQAVSPLFCDYGTRPGTVVGTERRKKSLWRRSLRQGMTPEVQTIYTIQVNAG